MSDNNLDPLQALLRVRAAINEAVGATERYGYVEFNHRMEAFRNEAIQLFRMFDKEYSDDPS